MRLTVWRWRATAVAPYERPGFVRSVSWEDRDGLVRLQRSLSDGVPWPAPRVG